MTTKAKTTKEDASVLRSIDDALPIALLRVREAVMVRFRPHLANYDITEQQWRVIRSVAEAEEIEATTISEESCILMPSLSRILKALEAKGILTRSKVVRDGRRQNIRLTQKGQSLFEEMAPKSAEIYREIESACGKTNIDKLVRDLKSLQGRLN